MEKRKKEAEKILKDADKNSDVKYGKKSILNEKDSTGKFRITLWVDGDILDAVRKKADSVPGGKYQTLINDTLRAIFVDKSFRVPVTSEEIHVLKEILERLENQMSKKLA